MFLRFLRFGFFAWGGPFAQIAMLKHELVEQEHWVTPARFHRALSLYQLLPGPEAHELAVYFGMVARGRLGGLVAGLGFMLPGFGLMLLLSWAYARYGTAGPRGLAAFSAIGAVVAALIVRAVHRIGKDAVTTAWHLVLALTALAAQGSGVSFLLTLAAAGAIQTLVARRRPWLASAGVLFAVGALAAWIALRGGGMQVPWGMASHSPPATPAAAQAPIRLGGLALLGLKAGLFTFGGAYTAIPLVRREAVLGDGWLTDAQFLDGLALGGVLPAPLIIFTTFVGYMAGGLPGALVITVGTFLPAFSFTLLAHERLERLVEHPATHAFLEGVMAGVVGIVAATTLTLLPQALRGGSNVIYFTLGLVALYLWKSRYATPALILGAGLLGWMLG